MCKKSVDPLWYGVWAEITSMNQHPDKDGIFWVRVTVQIPLTNVYRSRLLPAFEDMGQVMDDLVQQIDEYHAANRAIFETLI